MKTVASIDIGSNSIMLLVANVKADGSIMPLLEDTRTPRLAHDLKETGIIAEKNLKRAISDIVEFIAAAKSLNADEIYAVATQAVRSAKNKKEIITRIKLETGLAVEVISGKKEAELTYLGAITGISRLKKRRLMIDIGGASSEFVVASGSNVNKALSLDIGAVSVTEQFKSHLKTSKHTLALMEEELDSYFRRKLKSFKPDDFDLISCGGTISTYKMLDIKRRRYDARLIHGRSLSLKCLDKLIGKLADMKLSERKRVITFDPDRAGVIIAGGMILSCLMRYFEKKTVRVSTRSLRWGFLISKL